MDGVGKGNVLTTMEWIYEEFIGHVLYGMFCVGFILLLVVPVAKILKGVSDAHNAGRVLSLLANYFS
ncbi:Hypothetical predicted protein [Cloeon dipterum]|uniref:Uncharacterized protein n=1 Tax=Cloeon dipterum TaxID=197152 RepID=A0A8S1D461_9INSE|nr:Hypothetical predicted protein [Cloeon dipterum]